MAETTKMGYQENNPKKTHEAIAAEYIKPSKTFTTYDQLQEGAPGASPKKG